MTFEILHHIGPTDRQTDRQTDTKTDNRTEGADQYIPRPWGYIR